MSFRDHFGNLLGAGIGVDPTLYGPSHVQSLQAQLTQAQLTQAQIDAMMQAQQANVNTPVPISTMAQRARELFLKRMGGIRAEMKVPLNDFIACHVYQDQVYLFYLLHGKEGVVKEHMDMFPSDQLIAQFRMVLA